jgi:hypothetical protein
LKPKIQRAFPARGRPRAPALFRGCPALRKSSADRKKFFKESLGSADLGFIRRMPPRASSFNGHSAPRAENFSRENARDVLWGRPIFHAPQLPNPQVIRDPLPFRTQSFSPGRPVNGR